MADIFRPITRQQDIAFWMGEASQIHGIGYEQACLLVRIRAEVNGFPPAEWHFHLCGLDVDRDKSIKKFQHCIREKLEGKFVPIRDCPMTLLLRDYLRPETAAPRFIHFIVTLGVRTTGDELRSILDLASLLLEWRSSFTSHKKSARK